MGAFSKLQAFRFAALLSRPFDEWDAFELGVIDAAIAGLDWILDRDVVKVTELVYAKQLRRPVRWVVAVPADSPIREVADLAGKRIATEAVELTQRFLVEHGVTAEVEFSKHLPCGVSLHSSRMRLVETTPEALTEMTEEIEASAQLLGTAGVDIICYACTTGSLLKGRGADLELVTQIELASGVPAVATAPARSLTIR